MLGALPPEVLRRVGQQEVASRQGGDRPDRCLLCDRGQGAVRPTGRTSGASGRDGAAPRRILRLGGEDRHQAVGKSELVEGFRYTIKRRDARSRFLTDVRLEIDNNIAENAMRAIALGRKNYLFAGADTGGEWAAAMYTIVQTAKLNGVNPETYLRDTLAKIADGHPINRIDQLMPWTMS